MTEKRKPTATITPFGLRLQPALRQRLEEACEESGHSLNAEITRRLEASFSDAQPEIVRTHLTELHLRLITERLDEQQQEINRLKAERGDGTTVAAPKPRRLK